MRQRRARGERTTIGEFVLRVNYMASIFWSSLSLLVLLAYPRSTARSSARSSFAIAAPYFLAMAIDLRYCGYKALDVVRIYAFNLLLLPVNLSGCVGIDRPGADRRARAGSTARRRSATAPRRASCTWCCPT